MRKYSLKNSQKSNNGQLHKGNNYSTFQINLGNILQINSLNKHSSTVIYSESK